jgi:hypothetical protein
VKLDAGDRGSGGHVKQDGRVVDRVAGVDLVQEDRLGPARAEIAELVANRCPLSLSRNSSVALSLLAS